MTGGLKNSGSAPDESAIQTVEPATRSQSFPLVRSTVDLVLGLAPVLGATMVFVVLFYQPPASGTGAEGGPEQLFAMHCASCHQAGGVGIEGTFPPLAGNPAAADLDYVETVIRDGLSGPIEVLGVNYDTVMPPAVALTDPAQIAEVAQYVVELAAPGDTPDAASTDSEPNVQEQAGPVVGDIDRGHDLFTGASRFDQGGASCSACHTAGSVGNLGGQSLGPDLTGVYETLGGEAGLTGWLANPPSPTMQPLFVDRPINEAELADLVAFLADAPEQEKPSGVDRLSLAGLGGLAILIGGMGLAWRGMRQTYVERLRSRR